MNLQRSLFWCFPFALASGFGATALATTIELDLLPVNGSEAQCPTQLVAHETPRPYTEGGYTRDGMIKLSEVATDIRIKRTDLFSTTWVGVLKPEYQSCEASAIINRIDDEVYVGHSYLQVQLVAGQATVTFDITGIPDANGFTSTLLLGGVRDGNPRWTWGGTD